MTHSDKDNFRTIMKMVYVVATGEWHTKHTPGDPVTFGLGNIAFTHIKYKVKESAVAVGCGLRFKQLPNTKLDPGDTVPKDIDIPALDTMQELRFLNKKSAQVLRKQLDYIIAEFDV